MLVFRKKPEDETESYVVQEGERNLLQSVEETSVNKLCIIRY